MHTVPSSRKQAMEVLGDGGVGGDIGSRQLRHALGVQHQQRGAPRIGHVQQGGEQHAGVLRVRSVAGPRDEHGLRGRPQRVAPAPGGARLHVQLHQLIGTQGTGRQTGRGWETPRDIRFVSVVDVSEMIFETQLPNGVGNSSPHRLI